MTGRRDANSRRRHPCGHQRGGGNRLIGEDIPVVHSERVQSVAVFAFIFVFIVVIIVIVVGGDGGDETERWGRKGGTRKTLSAGLWHV